MADKEKATIEVATNTQGKDTDKNQYSKILSAFSSPKTMLMAARETGIERANVCRYVDSAIKQGTLFLIRYGLCTVSSHRAGYYSTDKRLVRIPLQLDLFQEKKPVSIGKVMAEAGKVPTCPRSNEESLLFFISRRKEGNHGA